PSRRLAATGGRASGRPISDPDLTIGWDSRPVARVVPTEVAIDLVHHDPDQARPTLLQLLEGAQVIDGALRSRAQDVEDAVRHLGELDGVGIERAGGTVQQ